MLQCPVCLDSVFSDKYPSGSIQRRRQFLVLKVCQKSIIFPNNDLIPHKVTSGFFRKNVEHFSVHINRFLSPPGEQVPFQYFTGLDYRFALILSVCPKLSVQKICSWDTNVLWKYYYSHIHTRISNLEKQTVQTLIRLHRCAG